MTSSPVRSLGDLLRLRAATEPDAAALRQGDGTLTWAQVDAAVTAAATGLAAAGAVPGDRVAISLAAGPQLLAAYLGALRGGYVGVPLNPGYTEREVDEILADCGARLHVTAASAAAVLAGDGPDPRSDRTGDAVAALAYTSGTSGRPRGAMLPARALLANLDQLAAVRPPLLGPDDLLFLPLPLTHVFGLNAGIGMALRTGASVVLPAGPRFDPAATLEEMAGATVVVAVPGQYAAWLEVPGGVERGFAQVRLAVSGSATLPGRLAEGYAAHGVALREGYGLAEATAVVSVDTAATARRGSVGQPLPGIEVQLRDADGEVAEAGDPGRIHVRGPNLFCGYWPLGEGGPDADGWFATDDVGVVDAEGELCLVGRVTEVIVVNGFRVYPAEVEAVLGADPAVAEVAVIGVPDETTGEAVRAYVVPAAGATLRPEELLALAARSLARFKLPAGIEVVTALPRTVTGKVRKWALGGRDGGE